MIAFVQPFGLRSPGGGPRILRALLRSAPVEYLSVCTSVAVPPLAPHEVHLPPRRPAGRLDQTRLGAYFDLLAWSNHASFDRRLVGLLGEHGVRAVHAVAHDLSFARALAAARELDTPFYLSVHDDLSYVMRGRPDRGRGCVLLGSAWRAATWRFVVTEALGEEYCRRYGTAAYLLVSDGVKSADAVSRPSTRGRLRVYFMGLLHLAYEANFLALLDSLDDASSDGGSPAPSLTCRCGSLPLRSLRDRHINVLPFDDEETVAEDLRGADLLYLPLPFGAEHEAFARFSLSTKLVTYLGSGIPILYHGPPFGTAHDLLAAHDAAFLVTSLDRSSLATVLRASAARRQAVTANALALAREKFLLQQQQHAFWDVIQSETGVA